MQCFTGTPVAEHNQPLRLCRVALLRLRNRLTGQLKCRA